MNDIMLDLETMGNRSNAPIIAIGAVAFDIATKTIGEQFYVKVGLESSVNAGAVIDPSTVIWWLGQSDAARKEFENNEKAMRLSDALIAFSAFVDSVSTPKDVRIWGNGAAFDNVILSNAYNSIKLPRPWEFWNDRCYRTVKNLYPKAPFVRYGTAHNALNDAGSQAIHLMEMLG